MKYTVVIAAMVLVMHARHAVANYTFVAHIDHIAEVDTLIHAVRNCIDCRRVLEIRDCFRAVSFDDYNKLCYAVPHNKLLVIRKATNWTTFVPTEIAVFNGSTLMNSSQQSQVATWYGNHSEWNLIYKASVHGFGAATFHSKCNNKGENIGVIRSANGYLFGWYTSLSWTSRGGYATDAKAFIFTLTNPAGIATKFVPGTTTVGYAIHDTATYGPTLGGGHDIYVRDLANTTSGSYIGFPHSYVDTTGRGQATFTGAREFLVADVEVFERVK